MKKYLISIPVPIPGAISTRVGSRPRREFVGWRERNRRVNSSAARPLVNIVRAYARENARRVARRRVTRLGLVPDRNDKTAVV